MHRACVNTVHKLRMIGAFLTKPSHRLLGVMTKLQIICTIFAHKTYTLAQAFRRFYHVILCDFAPVNLGLLPTLHTPYNNDYKLNYIYIL